jgi:hypothetical protein
MFPCDAKILAALATEPETIPEVLAQMQAIDALVVDGDGLKWFNWLYWQVTQAVQARVQAPGGFADPALLAALDVQFARLYFDALCRSLSNQTTPDCWQTLFDRRADTSLGRIQFAMAGMNAHINHDLTMAVVATCTAADSGTPASLGPQHATVQYNDYTALNTTLDSLIEMARATLHLRLLGDALPAVSPLEDTLAGWSMSAAREAAWNNAELLWRLRGETLFATAFLDSLDGLTAVVGKGMLIPIP